MGVGRKTVYEIDVLWYLISIEASLEEGSDMLELGTTFETDRLRQLVVFGDLKFKFRVQFNDVT